MDVLHSRCAGIDVHKQTVVVCVRIAVSGSKASSEARTFGTFTSDLLAAADWLEASGVTHVAMESTGSYWRPVYNVLEGRFELLVANAHHVKNVPGRKTDVKDAEWLADLLAHGLLKASFVPEPSLRALRDLTRGRSTLVAQRATLSNRIQKLLEEANIKLGSVASDVLGASGRDMLREMANGQSDPVQLAELARGQMRKKIGDLQKALRGQVMPHQRILLRELLAQVESLDSSIRTLETEVDRYLRQEQNAPFEAAVSLLQSTPGVGETSAHIIISEIGADMARFGSADRICAWGGAAPGNNQSAGKRLPGGKRHGNKNLLTCLVECAASATRMTGTYYHALYRRIAARRGKKRALIAVAHSMLRAFYYMISNGTRFQDLGADHFEKSNKQRIVTRLTKRLTAFGYDVTPSKEAITA
jgi:transposase